MEFVQIRKRHFFSIGEKTGYEESIWDTPPSDDSLLKMLYLAMIDITKKWTGHRQDWGQIHSQLEIFFEERLERL